MIENYVVYGRVSCMPRRIGEHTDFLLQTSLQMYRVIRVDPQWQKRDILFLRMGQTVQVTGRHITDHVFLACRIVIEKTGKEESAYGDPDKR